MFDSKQPYEMVCEEDGLLIIPMWINDPGITDNEREAFKTHLINCSICAQEYEKTGEIVSLIKKYWEPISERTRKLPGQAERPIRLQSQVSLCHRQTMSAEEGWEDLKRRIPELARLEKYRKRIQLLSVVTTLAASLVIGVFIWLVFSIYSRPPVAQDFAPYQVAFSTKGNIKIELLSDNRNVIIPAGTEIKTTAKELKTLIINGKHRMVMNVNTVLEIEPLVENSSISCLVKLASGQIYTYVGHDGNPFVVETAHGKALITGTAFNVKVTNTNTMLVVKGTVQFESEEDIVEVVAGGISEIVAGSVTIMPMSCNTSELTAWETGHENRTALTMNASSSDTYGLDDLEITVNSGTINLESIDHEAWIEKNRDWFKQEFPWIFQLQEAFLNEGIEVGYPELLVKTGDVWQFTCLEVQPMRFSVIDPNSLFKTASDYGFGKLWLLENVPVAKAALEKPVLSGKSFSGLAAFERLLEYFDEAEGLEPPTPIHSFHASKYLANTRSLLWFAVRDGQYDLTDQDRIEILWLLQDEVMAACNCQNSVLYTAGEQKKTSCGEDKCRKLVDWIVGYLKTMKAIEESIAEYEINKEDSCQDGLEHSIQRIGNEAVFNSNREK